MTSSAQEGERLTAENAIRAGTIVGGDLTGTGGFLIEGRVVGSVYAGGSVIVCERAVVEGNIRGPHVVVLGCVRGDVHTDGAVELGPGAQIAGEIHARAVGPLNGSIDERMAPAPTPPAVAVAAEPESAPSSARFGTVVPPSAVPPPHWSGKTGKTDADPAARKKARRK
jgi:cytoskeletal protein CcmA (bactofilin family)